MGLRQTYQLQVFDLVKQISTVSPAEAAVISDHIACKQTFWDFHLLFNRTEL